MGLGQLLNSATFKTIGAKGVTWLCWMYFDGGKVLRNVGGKVSSWFTRKMLIISWKF